MATVTLDGSSVHTIGELPAIGSQAPGFKLTRGDLSDVTLDDFRGERVLLNIVASLETGTCATSARKFNDYFAGSAGNILTISADLPFAMSRFCDSEALDYITPLSMMRSRQFAKDYGVLLVDGAFAGLAARAVVVIDEDGKVVYTQLVDEIADEPDYDAALAALRGE